MLPHYEQTRAANIRRNQELLSELNLQFQPTAIAYPSASKKSTKRKRKGELSLPPSRSSARLASSRTRLSYNEDNLSDPVTRTGKKSADESMRLRPHRLSSRIREAGRGDTANRASRSVSTAASRNEQATEHTSPRPSKDELKEGLTSSGSSDFKPTQNIGDLMTQWTAWEAVADPPTRDGLGTFHFADEPTFLPNKSPAEMLREGAFGGSYYRPLRSKKLGVVVEGDWQELPEEWVEGLDVDIFLASPDYNPEINKYKVSCGQSIEEWEAAGWINHEYDVRGWFQWYSRFYRGRRCDDDERQISRWRKCVGETGRWRRTLLKRYKQLGVHTVFDDGEDEDAPEVSPVVHQTCHHWAWEIRQETLDAYWANS